MQLKDDADKRRQLSAGIDKLVKANPGSEARYREQQRKLADDIRRLDADAKAVRADNDRSRALLDSRKKDYDGVNKKRVFKKRK